MEVEVNTAIIGAAAAILGAAIPQILSLFATSQNYKRELKKEYHLNKVKVYGSLFSIISELIRDITDEKRKINLESLLKNHVEKLDDLLLREGIWLDDEEIEITNKIIKDLGAIIIDEMERKANLPLSNFDSNLIKNIELLRNICRSKARKAFFQN
jgi:hypothetical protein